jgi:MYXO-CTERM domain-containing protein
VPAETSEDSGGCGCQVPGTSSTPPGAALAALSALGMLFSRRRRRLAGRCAGDTMGPAGPMPPAGAPPLHPQTPPAPSANDASRSSLGDTEGAPSPPRPHPLWGRVPPGLVTRGDDCG